MSGVIWERVKGSMVAVSGEEEEEGEKMAVEERRQSLRSACSALDQRVRLVLRSSRAGDEKRESTSSLEYSSFNSDRFHFVRR